MYELPASLNQLFVVRFWAEAAPQPQWRGSVEHIPTGQKLYFVSMRDLTDFIALQLGAVGQTVLNDLHTQ